MTEDLKFRPLAAEDANFVRETWLGTYRNSPYAGVIANNRFDEVTEDVIKQLFARGAKGLAAYDPAHPESVLGYVVTETCRTGEPVVHYLFVRSTLRQKGLGSKLLEKAGIDKDEKFFYTFRTTHSRHFKQGRYVPSIARRKDP